MPKRSSAASAAKARKPRLVAYFGDSITFESSPVITADVKKRHGWKSSIYVVPGRAVCDLQRPLVAALRTRHPRTVVLETMGNSTVFSPCMTTTAGRAKSFGSTAWLDKYRADLGKFFRTAATAHAKVLFVNPIPSSDETMNAGLAMLTKAAEHEAKEFPGISITNGPRDAVSSQGAFTWNKPCLASETEAMGCDPKTRTIAVRAPDGLHLCPTGLLYINPGCLTYSSGEARFGAAIVNATFHLPKPARAA